MITPLSGKVVLLERMGPDTLGCELDCISGWWEAGESLAETYGFGRQALSGRRESMKEALCSRA